MYFRLSIYQVMFDLIHSGCYVYCTCTITSWYKNEQCLIPHFIFSQCASLET
uniref:Uncharacterized protein n=1 Tax=Oryza brachyantha TaxID=4533 RepID=J3L0G1_ORYBR